MLEIKDLSERVLSELAFFVLGEGISYGMSRSVFEHPHDETKVIKVENSTSHFQNVMEWETWNECRECPDLKKWLAPCHYISDSGTFLIMEKTVPLTEKEKPKKLPAFLSDHKIENFGKIGTRIVSHDYGFVIKNLSTRMLNWRGD